MELTDVNKKMKKTSKVNSFRDIIGPHISLKDTSNKLKAMLDEEAGTLAKIQR